MNYFIKLGREFGHAYMSFFNSLANGSERMQIDLGFYGVDNFKDSWTQKERLGYQIYLLAKEGALHINLISKIVEIVMTEYYSILPEEIKNKIFQSAGLLFAHVVGKAAAAKVLTRVLLKKILYNHTKLPNVEQIVKAADSAIYIFLAESVFDQSARGANYLKANLPRLYNKLYNENLEALFFVVQKPLEPYVKLIKLCGSQHEEFEKEVCKMYENL